MDNELVAAQAIAISHLDSAQGSLASASSILMEAGGHHASMQECYQDAIEQLANVASKLQEAMVHKNSLVDSMNEATRMAMNSQDNGTEPAVGACAQALAMAQDVQARFAGVGGRLAELAAILVANVEIASATVQGVNSSVSDAGGDLRQWEGRASNASVVDQSAVEELVAQVRASQDNADLDVPFRDLGQKLSDLAMQAGAASGEVSRMVPA